MNIHSDTMHDIMRHCLKEKGKWWANHFFRNKEVNDLYQEIIKLPLDQVWDIVRGRIRL